MRERHDIRFLEVVKRGDCKIRVLLKDMGDGPENVMVASLIVLLILVYEVRHFSNRQAWCTR